MASIGISNELHFYLSIKIATKHYKTIFNEDNRKAIGIKGYTNQRICKSFKDKI